MTNLFQIQKEFRRLGNPEKAVFLQRFFRTGKGEYAEGDVFLGITVPTIRDFAKTISFLPQKNRFELLKSKYHEERLLALFLLVSLYRKSDEKNQEIIYRKYLQLAPRFVNNWDLVDSSAHLIVGAHLEKRRRDVLYKLARSKNLWERRISIISTMHFIRQNDLEDTYRISEILLNDKHDLIHKAVGWMLREAGKKNRPSETRFLNRHASKMPRTALRYAIEKYPETIRKKYLVMKKKNA